jgi:hypothetical protein
VFVLDDSTTVVVDSSMVQGGWPGGQGVQWSGSVGDEMLVTYSRGKFGGFLVWGSNEAGDDYAATTRNQPYYQFATMLFGASVLSTSSYERYTLASRLAPPLVPLTYSENDILYFSLRGLWTKEDELTFSGDPDAPSVPAGIVTQAPQLLNREFLGIQTTM